MTDVDGSIKETRLGSTGLGANENLLGVMMEAS